ncbi:putative transporter.16c [Ceratocystis platani]|uniref:Putative transporter.16c n=1 Tax=Ceratocystis fimbriata f. sp. platani TaxID=88771 RepID=A0A0F8CPD1_CERFI|nr:putative transporter.16c [Ceratocystis platani]
MGTNVRTLATENSDSSSIQGRDMDPKREATRNSHDGAPVSIDPKAEARLLMKLDLYLIPTASILYLFCFIDRNARIAGMDEDLKMVGYDFNVILTCFYISYILFEVPSNILCKHFGPGWYIPSITIAFGLVSICNAWVNTVSQACGVRFLLGMFEAGMFPGIAYYLSRWYRSSELTFRLGLYVVTAPLAGAFGGLLASAILTMDGFGSFHRWRMLFAIEGIITCVLGLAAFFTMTDRPETATWLTAEEKAIISARLAAERLNNTEVLDKMSKSKLMAGMINPVILITSFVFLLNTITVSGIVFFIPTIVRSLYPDSSTVVIQLRTVPPYVVGAFFTVTISYISWKINRRQILLILSCPLTMVGFAIFLGSTDHQVLYVATFFVCSSTFALGSLTNSTVSANVVTDTARAAAIGFNVMTGSIGGLISTWSYLQSDWPKYTIGNGLNMAVSSLAFIVTTLTLIWMKSDNKKRDGRNIDAELAGRSPEELSKLEWRHPAWRWKP